MHNEPARVLHFGPYEGMEIETVVDLDPLYIVETAAMIRGHGISHEAVGRAQTILDSREDHDDFEFVEDFFQDEDLYE